VSITSRRHVHGYFLGTSIRLASVGRALVDDEVMGSPMYPGEAEQLSADLAHASASAVWSRALETFGDETKARHWMNTPRDIFKGRIAAGSRQHRRSRRAAARAHGSDSNRLRRLLITSPILITTPNENLPDAPRGAVGGELFRGHGGLWSLESARRHRRQAS
jgi:hypothetical protein